MTPPAPAGAASLPVEQITRSILVLRGQRVLLDAELAELYGVSTKGFNQQVRRNRDRFPADFMLQLSVEEHAALRSTPAGASTANTCRTPSPSTAPWPLPSSTARAPPR